MNKQGEFKITGMMLSILFAFGLFIGFIGFAINSVSTIEGYDTTGYDSTELEKFNQFEELNATITANQDAIDNSNVDKGAFDFFAAIWDRLASPFRNVYNSFNNLITVFQSIVTLIGLPKIFSEFFAAAIVILVLIGIVMIKFKFGRNK